MVRSNERNHGLLTEKDLSPLNSSGMWEVLPTVLKQRLQLASTKKGDCRRSSRSPVARLSLSTSMSVGYIALVTKSKRHW